MSYNYMAAFTELNDACLSLRDLLLTLSRFKLVYRVNSIYKPLRKKYFHAHMHGFANGVTPGYIPKRVSI